MSNTPQQSTTIDLIILSLASNPALRQVTENCLVSLRASETQHPDIVLNIVVIESCPDAPPYEGANVQTIYPGIPFGYHTYMNLGIKMTHAPYICLCNNDLIFHPDWAKELLDAFAQDEKLQSASPLCSIHHPTVGLLPASGLHYGYGIRREIAGWCLCFKRSMLEITGPLDEQFRFWFADNDYAKTLEKHALPHALVTSSIVDHVESKTLKTQSRVRQRLLTKKAKLDFDRKWNGLHGLRYARKLISFYLKLCLLPFKAKKDS
ncbi:glycosyltransferase family 2 protein [Azonexus sp.]|uniref:glycosyltransferase family 2 protein n=1 Tax=Azonexus sp. TaxID=1872668 RepID=UPI0027BA50C4|nr:glycosyltransferase [Azonexus sp.]